MKQILLLLLGCLVLAGAESQAAPLGTAFTYQGRLDQNGQPAVNGLYGLRFALYAIDTGGSPLETNLLAVAVTNGLFVATLDFGAISFTGDARWLEVSVNTNTVSPTPGYLVLRPRTRLTPTPNAIYASTAGNVATVGAPAPGQVLTYDGSSLVWQPPGTPGNAWSLGGNNAAAGNFLGTLNNLPVEMKVNNARVARLEPTAGAPNVILGRANNVVNNGVVAGTIGGGEGHSVAGNHSTVSGGNGNSCGSNAAFVGGGSLNHADGSSSTLAGGYDNTVSGAVSFIGGGARNRVSSTFSSVGGGENNTVSADYGTIAGGLQNAVTGLGSGTVGGGVGNTASGDSATVPGGSNNDAAGNHSFAAGRGARALHDGSFVWADRQGTILFPTPFESTAPNQFSVRASGGARFESEFLEVVGSGNERAYLGGDSFGNDIQVGSLNPNVTDIFMYNAGNGTHMHTHVGVLTIHGGADLAEPFPMKEEEVEKGSVVVIDDEHPGRLKLSRRAYDSQVAGIVSGANGINPGIALKQEGALDQGQNVALTGRVYVKADASHGAIKPGDLLTTSDTPGHAMKVADHTRSQGAILGKAMSPLKAGTGLVLVLVTLQ